MNPALGISPVPVLHSSVGRPRRVIRERGVATLLVLCLICILIVIIAIPLWSLLSKSVENASGGYVGLANFRTYFSTPSMV